MVEYDSNFYAFVNEEQLEKFMRTPWKYSNLTLPMKLPPPIAPIPISGLPVVGYLEQSLASALTKALVAVGTFKPTHPFKDPKQSASEYIGLYLKSKNPQSKEWIREKYSKKLKSFEGSCELLTSLTSNLAGLSSLLQNNDPVVTNQLETFLRFKP